MQTIPCQFFSPSNRQRIAQKCFQNYREEKVFENFHMGWTVLFRRINNQLYSMCQYGNCCCYMRTPTIFYKNIYNMVSKTGVYINKKLSTIQLS